MGDRASVSFSNSQKDFKGNPIPNADRERSVVLFSHWGGMDFVNEAYRYARELKARVKGKHFNPLDRLEPGTVMVDFIRHITEGEEVIESNLYLGATEEDGDNSDNGHHDIQLDTLDEKA